MKECIESLFVLFFSMLSYTLYSQNCCSQINYTNWVLRKEWSIGFKALPDVSTNLSEFYSQYQNNGTLYLHG